jgi:ABC-type sugar transport system permease subunit
VSTIDVARTRKGLTLRQRRAIFGYLFVSPFIVGFVLFFLSPFIRSIIFSLGDIDMGPDGYILNYVGFTNYSDAFLVDPDFRQELTTAVVRMVTDVPIIIIFSFFAATLLNQAFVGRSLARSIFFLPVILSAGIIATIEQNDVVLSLIQDPGQDANSYGGLLATFDVETNLVTSRLHPAFVGYIIGAIDRIYQVITDSGVQILIFLAGLQSIPASLYEASNMEGATGWENFWKITFPMVSPLILVCALYSVIDSFTRSTNTVITFIQETAFEEARFAYSSALSWIYFLCVALFLIVIMLIFRRRVFYHT